MIDMTLIVTEFDFILRVDEIIADRQKAAKTQYKTIIIGTVTIKLKRSTPFMFAKPISFNKYSIRHAKVNETIAVIKLPIRVFMFHLDKLSIVTI